MRLIAVFAIVLVFEGLVFSQKLQDTGQRKSSSPAKLSTSPTHKMGSSHNASAALKTGSSSSNELAKIEQGSVKPVRKASQHSAGSAKLSKSATSLKSGNKPMKFSYKPPQSGSRRGSASRRAH